MQRHDVGAAQQLVELDLLDAQARGLLPGEIGVVYTDAEVEGTQGLDHAPADPRGADDSHPLVQVADSRRGVMPEPVAAFLANNTIAFLVFMLITGFSIDR